VTRDQILQVIDANRGRLSALGVIELALFGSYARGDAGPESDVDFVVQFTEKSFDRYMDLRELLEELLGSKVDLVLKDAIKSRLRERILREAVRAA
jgi:predicted nucleotidyltransferase